ncbi:peptide ABC transporter permease, partial [Salmonella enterica subsp. enterica serovar Weltevreden]|nr:peptide ABC transporter permease [Salmonella enterica subsp. enterica serovar Weltevreden]
MMLSKKNSVTLEYFSDKVEVEGRSLWKVALRR